MELAPLFAFSLFSLYQGFSPGLAHLGECYYLCLVEEVNSLVGLPEPAKEGGGSLYLCICFLG